LLRTLTKTILERVLHLKNYHLKQKRVKIAGIENCGTGFLGKGRVPATQRYT
jgi:hypothetical protein